MIMLKICYFHAKHVIPRYLRLFKAIYGLNAQKRLSQSFAGSFLEISVCPRVPVSPCRPFIRLMCCPLCRPYVSYVSYVLYVGLRASGFGSRASGLWSTYFEHEFNGMMSRHKNKLCDTGGKRNEYRAKHVGRLEIT